MFCGPASASTIIAGGGAFSQVNKATNLLNEAENTILTSSQRQSISNAISNEKLGNIFKDLYKNKDSLPGGTAGAIRYTAETGKLVGGSNHIEKGYGYLKSLQNILNTKSLNSQDKAIAQTLTNQLKDALTSVKK